MANRKADVLSDLQLKKLKKPVVKQWVRDGNGLGLCLTPAAKGDWRHWYFIYTSPETTKRRYYPIGSYPGKSLSDARIEATKLLAEVKKSVDPLERERRDSEARQAADEQKRRDEEAALERLTISELCKEYIEEYAMKHKKSWRQDEDLLKRDVIPVWGDRKVEDVTKRDVTLLLKGIVERGSPSMSNSVFRVIRKMFNYAVQVDHLKAFHSPCIGVKELAPNSTCNRNLTETEIKTFWQTIDKAAMSTGTKLAVKLVLVTAQRPGEVAGLHTGEIDGNWWTIPAERAKNKREHHVFLTVMAQELINKAIAHAKYMREMKPEDEYSGYVFPCREYKKIQPIAVTAMAKSIRRSLAWPLTDAKGSPLYLEDGTIATENKLEVEPFTPHDLRRSANTLMAASKIIKEHRERVLNHTLEKLDGTYNLYDYDDEKQMALETLERKIQSIITGSESAKVISIEQGRKLAA
jgi:integrase